MSLSAVILHSKFEMGITEFGDKIIRNEPVNCICVVFFWGGERDRQRERERERQTEKQTGRQREKHRLVQRDFS